jgi:hypothetical protein
MSRPGSLALVEFFEMQWYLTRGYYVLAVRRHIPWIWSRP